MVKNKSIIDRENRIRTCTYAIEALENASIGWFEDKKQVSKTIQSLNQQKENLQKGVA